MLPTPPTTLLALAYLGFISLGLPDATTGIVWPSVSNTFGIPLGNLGLILISSAVGYITASVFTGRLLQWLGVGRLLTLSSGCVAISLAGFAFAPTWFWYVLSAVLTGLGAGAIDSGLNAYASRRFSARHMTWLHACWGIGATGGATLTTSLLAQGLAWQSTYKVLAVIMLVLTLTFVSTLPLWQRDHGEADLTEHDETASHGRYREALRHPVVWLQMIAFFVYCGLEATSGQWAFTLLTQYRETSKSTAGTAVSVYWGALTVGRFFLGAIADRVGVQRLIKTSVTTAVLGGLVFVLVPHTGVAITGLAILGISLAPVYPGLMSITPRRLGSLSDIAVGLQVGAAMLGLVLIPSTGGLVLRSFGLLWLNLMIGVLVVLLWIVIHRGTLRMHH